MDSRFLNRADPSARVDPVAWRRLAWVWVLLAGVCFCTSELVSAEEDPDAVSTLIESARALPSSEAIAKLENALGAASKLDAARIQRAIAHRLVRDGSPYAALTHYERALEKDPQNVALLLDHAAALVATARANLGKSGVTAARVVPYLEDARVLLDRAEEGLAPEDERRSLLSRLRVEALFFAGELEATRDLLAGLPLATYPEGDQRAFHEFAAQVHWRLGDMTKSAEAFELAKNARGAAAAWTAAKRADQAMPAYLALLKSYPADGALWTRALLASRSTGGAEMLRRGLTTDGAVDKEAAGAHRHRVLGFLAEDAGERATAAMHYRAWAAAEPERAEPLLRIGNLALGSNTPTEDDARERAMTSWLAALKLEPENPRVHGVLWHLAGLDYKDIWRRAATGPSYRRTRAVQQALVEAVPQDATAWSNLGNTLRLGAEVGPSLAAYLRAAEENPHDPAIASDHGLALLGAGKPADALKAFDAALRIDEDHLSARQNAARVLWRRGADEKAQAHLHKALRAARLVDRDTMTWRYLLDRAWRTQQAGAAR